MRRLPTVVAFGGGHGLAATLLALKRITDHVTAVVTVADDGGSSGKLRQEFGCLPPGDLRMALAALCGDDTDGRLWADVLQTRFAGDGPLGGHAIGNLLIAALWQRDPDPVVGLDRVGQLLNAQGRVLPMSSQPVKIRAEIMGNDPHHPDDVSIIEGQHEIAITEGNVRRVWLTPDDPPACPDALESIERADRLVLGPGSWFTSVVPHLLVPQLREAITSSSARKILIMNLAGAQETSGFTASGHMKVLTDHCPELRLDVVIADPRFVGGDEVFPDVVRAMGAKLVVEDIAVKDGSARHDPLLLAATLNDVIAL